MYIPILLIQRLFVYIEIVCASVGRKESTSARGYHVQTLLFYATVAGICAYVCEYVMCAC